MPTEKRSGPTSWPSLPPTTSPSTSRRYAGEPRSRPSAMPGRPTRPSSRSTYATSSRDQTDPGGQAAGDRHLLAGASAKRRHPDLQGAGCRRDPGQLARSDGTDEDAAGRPKDVRRGHGEMVRTDEWRALLKERGWVGMYP